MENISNPAPETAPSASATILVSGVLLDSALNRPVDSSAILFRSGGDRIEVETATDGKFSVQLPRAGNWTIEQDKQKYPTFYAFAPKAIAVNGPGDVGRVSVQGDTAANARTLETYVQNVLVSGGKLFEEAMKKHDGNTLSESDVKTEAARVWSILSNSLHSVVKDARADSVELNAQQEPDETGVSASFSGTCCTTCRRRYATDQVKLQRCMCCPQCAAC